MGGSEKKKRRTKGWRKANARTQRWRISSERATPSGPDSAFGYNWKTTMEKFVSHLRLHPKQWLLVSRKWILGFVMRILQVLKLLRALQWIKGGRLQGHLKFTQKSPGQQPHRSCSSFLSSQSPQDWTSVSAVSLCTLSPLQGMKPPLRAVVKPKSTTGKQNPSDSDMKHGH